MQTHNRPHLSIPQSSLAGAVISFGNILKDHGISVSPPKIMDALRGVSEVGVLSIDDFKTALAACLITRAEEMELFQRLFQEYWIERFRDRIDASETAASDAEESPCPDASDATEDLVLAEQGASHDEDQTSRPVSTYAAYSPQEILRERDFRNIPYNLDRKVDRLIKEIVEPLLRRIGARRKASWYGPDLDFRRLLRRNMRYGGEIYDLPRIRKRLRIKRLVFICDVSGSMNPYLRFMLRFIREIQQLPTRVETFVFATRLTRITDLLARLPFAKAMEEIGKTVQDWQGGTRIGSCLQQLTAFRGGAMLRSSTVMLIFSDGWDRGDPHILEREMIRLHLRCYRIIWINPLLGGPAYEPTCRGMKTALPHVDSFLPGHNLASIERLAGTLRGILS